VDAASTDEAGDRFEICPLSSNRLLKRRTAQAAACSKFGTAMITGPWPMKENLRDVE